MNTPPALPLDFTAFRTLHRRACLRYASARLSPAHAEQAVEAAFTKLALSWRKALQQPDIGAWASHILEEEISRLTH
ncbi:hypothetical protein [Streptomyces sp. UNOC14_S4]|uniref:hypothetical protein n=1 Tax=Streptomyces sp. UNOC14_S4 TaxID=2872340 RepID=UPI001E4C72F3|nr:hypothetical protein [Streptomyces sp. UNOC14_S4]MCC3769174.1 hypothetical protein [Streptomyces sp. UNOC14_S4]